MAADPRCGSTAGYQAHYANNTPLCVPCRTAQADWMRHYRTRLYLNGGPLTVDATGTRRRLRALACNGWTNDLLAARLGVSGSAVRAWTYNERVRRSTVARVAALYDQLWDQPGASSRTAARAARAGWAPPLAWDDDTIDDPASRPDRGHGLPAAFDEIAVQRAMRGDRAVRLRPVERAEVVRRLTAVGLSATQIADRLGASSRTVVRARTRRADAEQAA